MLQVEQGRWVAIKFAVLERHAVVHITEGSTDSMLLRHAVVHSTVQKQHRLWLHGSRPGRLSRGVPAPAHPPAVLDDLQQHVEDIGVRLLNLVKQHHGEGTAPAGAGYMSGGGLSVG
jgi:hypothetical protein